LFRQDYAWDLFKKNTLASHAEFYPDLWYGIWSGPDSYNAPESKRPGEAAAHYATALTDFPIMNMNQHASPLIALIKFAGIFPESDGIRISPGFPLKRWQLLFPLLGINYSQERISGYYIGINNGSMKMIVDIPEKMNQKKLNIKINGENVQFEIKENRVIFTLNYSAGRIVSWDVGE